MTNAKMQSSKWKARIFLLVITVLFSVFALYVIIQRPSSEISSHEAATFICTILEDNEPVANVDVTLELLSTDGNRITINGVSGGNGSISADVSNPFESPVLLDKVALSNRWMIRTVEGDRIYRLPERKWNLTDAQAFLNGSSTYTFEEVQLQQSHVDGRVLLSLRLQVSPARILAVYNSPTQSEGMPFFLQRAFWRVREYVHFELEDVNFVPVEDSELVVMPEDRPLRLTVLANAFDFSWPLKIEVDVSGRDFVDLSAPTVRAISSAQVQQLSSALDVLADTGFDVTEQYRKLGEIRESYEKAALATELGGYSEGFEEMQNAWALYTEVFFYTRGTYANTLPWTISVTLILAFFSVMGAYLISERRHTRNLFVLGTFLVFLAIFAYTQPSLRLFLVAFSGVAERLDVYLLVSLFEVLPWIIVGVALSAYPRFRDLLWETFGVTVRNMRRRKLRTLLTLCTIIVVSASAMCLLSISPHVPSNRIPLSGLEPTVRNGLVVSRYEVLTPRPTGGGKAVRGDSYPLTIPPRDVTWMVNQSCVNQAAIYGFKQVRILDGTAQVPSDLSAFPLAIIEPSFVREYCVKDSEKDWWLDELGESAVSVGSRIAEAYGIRAGDEILIDDQSFEVNGIFDEEEIVEEWRGIDGGNFFSGIYDPIAGAISSESFLIGSVHDFQLDAFGIYKVSLLLNDPEEIDDFVGSLLQRGLSHEVSPLYDITRTFFLYVIKDASVTSAYYGQIRLELVGPWYAQMVVVTLSAMMVFANIFASVSERKSDILAMHVVGASPIRIRLVFIAEALVTGLMGGVYGYVIGYVLARAASLMWPATIQLSLSGSLPFVISISMSVLSSVLGSVSPSKKAILTVVPSRRMLRKGADIFSIKGERAYVDIPIRIQRNELDSFDSFLRNFAQRFPPVRYGYDGLSVLDVEKKGEEGELTYAIDVNYAVERSLYYKVVISLMKGEEPWRVQIAVYPLDPWERKVTNWSTEHAGLLPRLAACLRNELLRYAEWKEELLRAPRKAII